MSSSRIVKTGSGEASSAVAFHFDDIARQAELHREAARRESESLLEAGRRKAEELREVGHREGYERGYREGRERAERESAERVREEVAHRLSDLTPVCQEIVEQFEAERDAWRAGRETGVVRLACAMAAKIVKGEVERDSEVVRRVVAEALSLAAGSPTVRLRLHPADAERLGSPLPAALAPMERIARIEVVPDATIRRGGCVVETEHGVVDAQIETQLRRIEKELAGE